MNKKEGQGEMHIVLIHICPSLHIYMNILTLCANVSVCMCNCDTRIM